MRLNMLKHAAAAGRHRAAPYTLRAGADYEVGRHRTGSEQPPCSTVHALGSNVSSSTCTAIRGAVRRLYGTTRCLPAACMAPRTTARRRALKLK